MFSLTYGTCTVLACYIPIGRMHAVNSPPTIGVLWGCSVRCDSCAPVCDLRPTCPGQGLLKHLVLAPTASARSYQLPLPSSYVSLVVNLASA